MQYNQWIETSEDYITAGLDWEGRGVWSLLLCRDQLIEAIFLRCGCTAESSSGQDGQSVSATSHHQRKGTARGLSAPSLTRGLWYSRPGLEWICAQHCSQ